MADKTYKGFTLKRGRTFQDWSVYFPSIKRVRYGTLDEVKADVDYFNEWGNFPAAKENPIMTYALSRAENWQVIAFNRDNTQQSISSGSTEKSALLQFDKWLARQAKLGAHSIADKFKSYKLWNVSRGFIREVSPLKDNPMPAPTKAQLAARALFAKRAKAGTLKVAPKKRAPAKRAANPVVRGEKTTERLSLVGSTQYAVLYYAGKNKPTGRPDIVFPARDKDHALKFADQLEAKGASGVILIEKTENRVK